MQLKQFLDDDRAVSPVIGVILMVAIASILAAVIGTFVLGLGDQVSQTTPQASFSFDYDVGDPADELTISHNGGDTLSASEVSVTISGATTDGGVANSEINSQHAFSNLSSVSSGDDISAGTTATVSKDQLNSSISGSFAAGDSLDLSSSTVRVVWQAAEGDSSAQLGTWNGPDA